MSDHDTSSGGLTPADADAILERLRCGEVDGEYGLMRGSSNYTFLVSVRNDDVETIAIYKPQRGERPLWDFPDGTLCYRELASYLTSRELGWDLVPPTIVREGPRGLGSFQLYIDHDPEVNYFTLTEAMRPQLMRLSAFDYIVNNADRKGGHCLIDADGHLWAIDHGITFHSAPKLRTVVWDFAGQPVPDPLLEQLDRLCNSLDDGESAFRASFDGVLSSHELRAFQARVRHLLKFRRYPNPGAGPNYPWPPV